jgi:ankyrin repeat protein
MTSNEASPKLFELLQEEKPKWEEISQRLKEHPEEALISVDNQTDSSTSNNLTALHHAVIKGKHPYSPEYLTVLKILLQLNGGATTVQCDKNGYTPLAYACSVDLLEGHLEDNAKVIEMLLKADNKEALGITCKEGLTPLALHIRSISRQRFLKDKSEEIPSTAVLKILAEGSSRQTLEDALETLYACNTSTIMQRFVEEEARARRNIKLFGRQTRAGATDFWVWAWALVILRSVHDRIYGTDQALFQALHIASQITDCPTPFLALAMRSSPGETRTPDRTTLNMPLHSVASWQLPEGTSSLCRKSMAVRTLESEYPAALKAKNKRKKTPMDLEEESGSFVGTGN